ncbi:hypothetical protein LY76DRAFT_609519 [Colletotrichum caudatum]|nr:hypothetical protein LY76DRAFT_609519 [Colletotrichum caudatum]
MTADRWDIGPKSQEARRRRARKGMMKHGQRPSRGGPMPESSARGVGYLLSWCSIGLASKLAGWSNQRGLFLCNLLGHKKEEEEEEEEEEDDDDIGSGNLSDRVIEDSLEAGKLPKSALSSANQPPITHPGLGRDGGGGGGGGDNDDRGGSTRPQALAYLGRQGSQPTITNDMPTLSVDLDINVIKPSLGSSTTTTTIIITPTASNRGKTGGLETPGSSRDHGSRLMGNQEPTTVEKPPPMDCPSGIREYGG